ncbi:MAG: hypothetical protein JSS49_12605 [Planctomycetes bacterium]|nr:hypothetical protein [Planctomycetota bacterium]
MIDIRHWMTAVVCSAALFLLQSAAIGYWYVVSIGDDTFDAVSLEGLIGSWQSSAVSPLGEVENRWEIRQLENKWYAVHTVTDGAPLDSVLMVATASTKKKGRYLGVIRLDHKSDPHGKDLTFGNKVRCTPVRIVTTSDGFRISAINNDIKEVGAALQDQGIETSWNVLRAEITVKGHWKEFCSAMMTYVDRDPVEANDWTILKKAPTAE